MDGLGQVGELVMLNVELLHAEAHGMEGTEGMEGRRVCLAHRDEAKAGDTARILGGNRAVLCGGGRPVLGAHYRAKATQDNNQEVPKALFTLGD